MSTLEISTDPLREAVLNARAEGACARAWARAWAEAALPPAKKLKVKILQTHYKPGSRARLVLRGKVSAARPRTGGKAPQFLCVQFYPSAKAMQRRAQAAREHKRFLKCFGPPFFAVAEWSALCWALPNGPRLRPLRSFLRKQLFLRLLEQHGLLDPSDPPSRPKLLRYVPRRRALLRYRLSKRVQKQGYVYVKLYSAGGDAAAAANLAAVRVAGAGAEFGFHVPDLLAHIPERRALLMQGLPGDSFSERLVEPQRADFELVGRALAGLHGSRIEPAARWSAARELCEYRAAVHDLRRVLPGLDMRLDRLDAALEAGAGTLELRIQRPIHANFFGDQVLIAGGRVGIVDWDDLALGDPLYDLGRLCAHVIYLAQALPELARNQEEHLGSLREAWASASATAIDRRRLDWHTAMALVMRAKISALRPLEPGWEERVAQSVERAQSILDGA